MGQEHWYCHFHRQELARASFLVGYREIYWVSLFARERDARNPSKNSRRCSRRKRSPTSHIHTTRNRKPLTPHSDRQLLSLYRCFATLETGSRPDTLDVARTNEPIKDCVVKTHLVASAACSAAANKAANAPCRIVVASATALAPLVDDCSASRHCLCRRTDALSGERSNSVPHESARFVKHADFPGWTGSGSGRAGSLVVIDPVWKGATLSHLIWQLLSFLVLSVQCNTQV